jgi:hypothetical protein
MYDSPMGDFSKGRRGDDRGGAGRLGAVETALLERFLTRDVEEWRRLLKTADARHMLQPPGSEFRRELFSSLRATPVENIEVDELQSVASMLSSLLETPLKTEERLRISIERCVVAAQQKFPRVAVSLAHEAAEAGVSCRAATILSTISKGVKFAETPEDLEEIARFTRRVFRDRMLKGDDPHVNHIFDMILAVTCDPRISVHAKGERVGPHYRREQSLLDVAHRARAGANFAEAVVAGGIWFKSERNEGRINLAVRGLVSVGASLVVEAKRLLGELNGPAFVTAMNQLQLRQDYPVPQRIEELGESWRAISIDLLKGALEISRYCFEIEEGASGVQEVRPRNALRGITICRLVAALELAAIDLRGRIREQLVEELSALMFCALSVTSCRDEISPACVQSALRFVNYDGTDAVARAEHLVTILHVGLDKTNNIELLQTLVKAVEGAPIKDEVQLEGFAAVLDRIDGHISELRSKAGRGKSSSPRTNAGPQETSPDWFTRLLKEGQRSSP